MKYFDDKQVKLISSWHQLSVNSDDEYMKFISNWICLNAICVHLYSDYANKERISIDRKKSKLVKLKSKVDEEKTIIAEEAKIIEKNNKLEVNIKFPERLCVYIQEKYTEDLVFEKFSDTHKNEIEIPDIDYLTLRKALTKFNSEAYVINMSKSALFNEFYDQISTKEMSDKNIIVLLDKNNLTTIQKVLYQIRCNIFHGEKGPGDLNDDRIVEASNPVLDYIIKHLLNKYDILIRNLENLVQDNNVPKSKELFAGANLIITTENNSPYNANHHKKYPQDIVIRSSHCYEISWIIFQLKEVYKKDINSNNKYEFYPLIGQVIKMGFENNYPLQKIYMNIIEACRNWKNNIVENFD